MVVEAPDAVNVHGDTSRLSEALEAVRDHLTA